MSDTNTTTTNEKPFTLADVKKTYFSPAELPTETTQATLGKVAGLAECRFNFDPNNPDSVPATHGILILPLQQRQGEGTEKKTVTVGVLIAAVPDPEYVMSQEKGMAFVRESVINAFSTTLGNAARPRRDGKVRDESIPLAITLADFIESKRGDEGLATFNALAKDIFVPALKKQGLTSMSVPVLRQVLSSASAAESMFPKIPQAHWEKLLDIMIAKAAALSKDASKLSAWKAQRNELDNTPDVESLDFDAFENLVDDDQDEATDQGEAVAE